MGDDPPTSYPAVEAFILPWQPSCLFCRFPRVGCKIGVVKGPKEQLPIRLIAWLLGLCLNSRGAGLQRFAFLEACIGEFPNNQGTSIDQNSMALMIRTPTQRTLNI